MEGVPHVGYYKATLERESGRDRKFRLLLFVDVPDRIHAEILSPLGNPQLIVDGGGGKMAVSFLRDDLSFVGAATPEVFDHLLGLELDLEQWVSAVRGGLEHPSISIDREGSGSLPDRLEMQRAGQRLTLELRRRQPAPADGSSLGVGAPPDGMRTRPLTDLLDEPDRFDELDRDSTPS